jgi:uncharacterized protein (TIGR03435 family)
VTNRSRMFGQRTITVSLLRQDCRGKLRNILVGINRAIYTALIVGLLTLGLNLAEAQDLSGIWQGTTVAGRASQRLVIMVSKQSTGSLVATIIRPDFENRVFPASLVLTGSSIRIVSPILGEYRGRVAHDLTSIIGKWSANGQKAALVLSRVDPGSSWQVQGGAVARSLMPTDADPKFEVAAIRPSASDAGSSTARSNGRIFTLRNYSLRDLIAIAYQVHPRQVVNVPPWADQKFDITATQTVEGRPSLDQRARMFQSLLSDRFKLQVHKGQKEFPVFLLEAYRPKLVANSPDSQGSYNSVLKQLPEGGTTYSVTAGSMNDFTSFLMGFVIVDREIVDRTGLDGKYNFSVTFGSNSDPEERYADIFNAIKTQLGLRLVDTKTPIDVIIVDSVQRPTDN